MRGCWRSPTINSGTRRGVHPQYTGSRLHHVLFELSHVRIGALNIALGCLMEQTFIGPTLNERRRRRGQKVEAKVRENLAANKPLGDPADAVETARNFIKDANPEAPAFQGRPGKRCASPSAACESGDALGEGR